MLKKILFLSLVTALYLTMNATAIASQNKTQAEFLDVGENHAWAKDAISYMATEGILDGIGDQNYAPDEGVTKEQLAKMLFLSLSLEHENEPAQTYTDVDRERWSFGYIEATKKFFAIEDGLPINAFNPEKSLSRQEVAVAIMNGMGLASDSNMFDKTLLTTMFADGNLVPAAIKTPVTISVERGILRGSDGMLRPLDPVTRAEAAVLVHRMILIREGRGELVFVTNTPMLGESQVTLEQAKKWAENRGAHQRFIDIADSYWKYGEITGIRPEILYAQAAKETAFGKYTGQVKPEQNNWAGIKTATANGDKPEDHETFETPDDGARAHFNHMCAYIGLEPVGEPHGRYYTATRTAWAGTVTSAEELGTKWAPEHSYGYSLVARFLVPMMETEV